MRSNVKKVDAKRAFTHMKKVSLTTLPSKLAASDASLQFALSDVSKKLKSRPMKVSSSDIVTMQFHVHGKVQGVFFRKYTAAKANELSLAGHVFNKYNAERSVEGIVTGPLSKVMQFKEWVSTVGSPKCQITQCETEFVETDASVVGASFIVLK